ncbi:MAG: aspartate/glutamate racemase family protein [Pseudomonadota bacterium]
MKRILVINPNSNPDVTDGIAKCVEPLNVPGRAEFECMTLAEGPFGIETLQHSEQVVQPLRRTVLERQDADAYIIACYSDPGLALCRETSGKPVFGIQESGLFAALQRGQQVGVIALGPKSIARHLPYVRRLGLMDRLAAERPLNLSVAESESAAAFPRIKEVAEQLREEDHADTLLLGCAGMAGHRAKLEDAVGLPVSDPTQAAATQALGAVLLA